MYSFEHLPHSISQQFHNEFLSQDSSLEVFWILDKTLKNEETNDSDRSVPEKILLMWNPVSEIGP